MGLRLFISFVMGMLNIAAVLYGFGTCMRGGGHLPQDLMYNIYHRR